MLPATFRRRSVCFSCCYVWIAKPQLGLLDNGTSFQKLRGVEDTCQHCRWRVKLADKKHSLLFPLTTSPSQELVVMLERTCMYVTDVLPGSGLRCLGSYTRR